MPFEPWMLAAMEENGLMDIDKSLIVRVARELENSENDMIGDDAFRRACNACSVDPDSFTEEDLSCLQELLD